MPQIWREFSCRLAVTTWKNDRRKQRQLQRAAQYYLATHRLLGRDARFDVVGVWWDEGGGRCELVRNAFDAV